MRIAKFVFAALVISTLAVGAFAQSVADAAKQPKPEKKASKVYTNDEIPSVDTSKDATPPKDAEANAGEAKADESSSPEAKAADADKDGDKKDGAAADSKKAEAEWKAKFAAQKQKVADTERELQITDREYKLRAAVFYADAGNRLRDDKKWADSERKYKDDMARLQKELDTGKQKLEDLRDEARKAGVKVD